MWSERQRHWWRRKRRFTTERRSAPLHPREEPIRFGLPPPRPPPHAHCCLMKPLLPSSPPPTAPRCLRYRTNFITSTLLLHFLSLLPVSNYDKSLPHLSYRGPFRTTLQPLSPVCHFIHYRMKKNETSETVFMKRNSTYSIL